MSAVRTFSEIRTELLELVNRTDLTEVLADLFIKDSLSRCNRILGTRIPAFEVEASLSADAEGAITIPEDFLELRDIEENLNPDCIFKPVDMAYIRRQRQSRLPTENPPRVRWYARKQNKWLFYPAMEAGTQIDIVYSKDQSLSGTDNATNATLTFAPELVKYGAAAYAADYFQDAERASAWSNTFDVIRSEIEQQLSDQELPNGSIYTKFPDEEY